MKMVLMQRWEGRGGNEELRAGKDASLYTFYLPMYACYFLLGYL
jgi:hypothetical protein